ncbi:UAA transporter [Artemisia annua]|uniref:UAA transporter n=1 Tax=Artemisia annua TaxID=35608 RepID=A0A2U1PAG1_ARTAN|nr:UAA transporter [Artemisia annua]
MEFRGRRGVELVFCITGIWSAYIYQGLLQETVSTKRFGKRKERFEHLAFLNLAQSAVCLLWSFIMIKLWRKAKGGRAPWWSYWSAGITNTIGPAMGIEALKYISYPAQVLAKSSKMIPVMLMGTLVYGIRYSFQEYLCSLLVAGGVSIFALAKTSSKTINKLANPNAPLGYGLCFLNLVFDGFTNATQDSISARYPKTNAWDMMLGMNLWGTVYNAIFMFGWPQASGYQAVQFCKNNPEAAWDILYYCLCGAIGALKPKAALKQKLDSKSVVNGGNDSISSVNVSGLGSIIDSNCSNLPNVHGFSVNDLDLVPTSTVELDDKMQHIVGMQIPAFCEFDTSAVSLRIFTSFSLSDDDSCVTVKDTCGRMAKTF